MNSFNVLRKPVESLFCPKALFFQKKVVPLQSPMIKKGCFICSYVYTTGSLLVS